MATPPSNGEFERDVVVIGGGGHVGLPLAIAFADRGARVAIYDVSEDAVARVNAAPHSDAGAHVISHDQVAAFALQFFARVLQDILRLRREADDQRRSR